MRRIHYSESMFPPLNLWFCLLNRYLLSVYYVQALQEVLVDMSAGNFSSWSVSPGAAALQRASKRMSKNVMSQWRR